MNRDQRKFVDTMSDLLELLFSEGTQEQIDEIEWRIEQIRARRKRELAGTVNKESPLPTEGESKEN